MDTKRGISNWVLLATSVIVAVVLCEVFLRFFDLSGTAKKSYVCPQAGHPAYGEQGQCPTSQDRISLMEFDPDLLYRPERGSTSRGISIDAMGFRQTPGNSGHLDSSTFVIVITGGSTAFGVGVRDEQTISAALAQMLPTSCKGKPISILNLAVSAQTSGQERRRLESILDSVKIDMHVSISGFNDVYNGWSGLSPHQNRDYYEVYKIFKSADPQEALPKAPQQESYNSRIHFLVQKLLFQLRFDESMYRKAVAKSTLEHSRIWQSMLRTIQIFMNWSESYDYDFIYALQPSIYSTAKVLSKIEESIKNEDKVFGDWHAEGYSYIRSRLVQWSGNHPQNYLDLDESIADRKDDLFIDNVHFGDKGYNVLAKTLAEHIKDMARFRGFCAK